MKKSPHPSFSTPTPGLNRAEAAAYVGVSNGQMGVWLRTGIAPEHARFGRRLVFRREDLDRFFRDAKRGAVQKAATTASA
jgi:hypothetical protein